MVGICCVVWCGLLDLFAGGWLWVVWRAGVYLWRGFWFWLFMVGLDWIGLLWCCFDLLCGFGVMLIG